MAYKSGTEKDISEIKKQLKPILEIPSNLDKLSKNLDKINKYKEQQRKIRFKKWEKRYDRLAEFINKHRAKKQKKEEIATIYQCDNCGNVVSEDSKYCPKCGLSFIDENSNVLQEKEKIIETLNKNIKVDVKKLEKDKIVEEIDTVIKVVNENYKLVNDYINSRKEYFDSLDHAVYQGTYNTLFGRIEEIEKNLKRDLSKELIIEEYRTSIKIYKRSNELSIGLLNKEKETKIEKKKKIRQDKNNELSSDDEYTKTEYEEPNEYNDDIVYNELEDWQKREVDEGNYDSYNFEEDELEEDDYYYEDDKE